MENIEEVPVKTKSDKGFTLVELLIVIVILGILATVTVFAVRGITEKGTTSACQADKKTLEVAIESWYALPASGANARADVAPLNIPSEADLLATNLMRSLSPKYDLDATGVLVVQDTACTL